MKYALSIFLFLTAFNAFSQVDSSKLYSYGLQFRANDLEQSIPLFVSSETYEDLFDLIKTKYKPTTPGGTTMVTIDSVRNDALIGWYNYLMVQQTGLAGAYVNRIRNALKAAPTSPFVIAEVLAIDAIWNAQQTAIGNEGKRRFQRARN